MTILKKLFLLKIVTLVVFSTTLLKAAQTITIDQFAVAIARAEGFGQRGALPTRYHNPGDLKARRGQYYFGQVRIGKGGHVIFRNDACGWYALRNQVSRMISGESRFYRPSMTLNDIAKKYAGNYRVWSRNVSKNLGVPCTSTLADLFDIPPTYDPSWERV